MDIKEALEKEIIFENEIETKENAIKKLIECRMACAKYYKRLREYRKRLDKIMELAKNFEVLEPHDKNNAFMAILKVFKEEKKLIEELDKDLSQIY